MSKSSKYKAVAYSINVFVLGLTGGWIIPADFYKPVSVVTALILLVMFLSDLKLSFPKDKAKGKTNKVKTKRKRPPKKRKRNKRK
ncbi:hypothetical protein B382_14633 [Stutzerimonas stutzeri B1SMN1]|nr:hypothetical protein B382_14633 [Stutzerimonas stutzeri B1SMN1]